MQIRDGRLAAPPRDWDPSAAAPAPHLCQPSLGPVGQLGLCQNGRVGELSIYSPSLSCSHAGPWKNWYGGLAHYRCCAGALDVEWMSHQPAFLYAYIYYINLSSLLKTLDEVSGLGRGGQFTTSLLPFGRLHRAAQRAFHVAPFQGRSMETHRCRSTGLEQFQTNNIGLEDVPRRLIRQKFSTPPTLPHSRWRNVGPHR
jgi:hypothetical protein